MQNKDVIPVLVPSRQGQIWVQSNKVIDLFCSDKNFTWFKDATSFTSTMTADLVNSVDNYTTSLQFQDEIYRNFAKVFTSQDNKTQIDEKDFSNDFLSAQKNISYFDPPKNYEGISNISDDVPELKGAFDQFSSQQKTTNDSYLNTAYSVVNLGKGNYLNANILKISDAIYQNMQNNLRDAENKVIDIEKEYLSFGHHSQKINSFDLDSAINAMDDDFVQELDEQLSKTTEDKKQELADALKSENQTLNNQLVDVDIAYLNCYEIIEQSSDWSLIRAGLIKKYAKNDVFLQDNLSPQQLVDLLVDNGYVEFDKKPHNVSTKIAELDDKYDIGCQTLINRASWLVDRENKFHTLIDLYNQEQFSLENQLYRDDVQKYMDSVDVSQKQHSVQINPIILPALIDREHINEQQHGLFLNTDMTTFAADSLLNMVVVNAPAAGASFVAGGASTVLGGGPVSGFMAGAASYGFTANYFSDLYNQWSSKGYLDPFINATSDVVNLWDSPNKNLQKDRINSALVSQIDALKKHDILSQNNQIKFNAIIQTNDAYQEIKNKYNSNQQDFNQSIIHTDSYNGLKKEFVSLLEQKDFDAQSDFFKRDDVKKTLQDEKEYQMQNSAFAITWQNMDMTAYFARESNIDLRKIINPEEVDLLQLTEQRFFLQSEILIRSNVLMIDEANEKQSEFEKTQDKTVDFVNIAKHNQQIDEKNQESKDISLTETILSELSVKSAQASELIEQETKLNTTQRRINMPDKLNLGDFTNYKTFNSSTRDLLGDFKNNIGILNASNSTAGDRFSEKAQIVGLGALVVGGTAGVPATTKYIYDKIKTPTEKKLFLESMKDKKIISDKQKLSEITEDLFDKRGQPKIGVDFEEVFTRHNITDNGIKEGCKTIFDARKESFLKGTGPKFKLVGGKFNTALLLGESLYFVSEFMDVDKKYESSLSVEPMIQEKVSEVLGPIAKQAEENADKIDQYWPIISKNENKNPQVQKLLDDLCTIENGEYVIDFEKATQVYGLAKVADDSNDEASNALNDTYKSMVTSLVASDIVGFYHELEMQKESGNENLYATNENNLLARRDTNITDLYNAFYSVEAVNEDVMFTLKPALLNVQQCRNFLMYGNHGVTSLSADSLEKIAVPENDFNGNKIDEKVRSILAKDMAYTLANSDSFKKVCAMQAVNENLTNEQRYAWQSMDLGFIATEYNCDNISWKDYNPDKLTDVKESDANYVKFYNTVLAPVVIDYNLNKEKNAEKIKSFIEKNDMTYDSYDKNRNAERKGEKLAKAQEIQHKTYVNSKVAQAKCEILGDFKAENAKYLLMNGKELSGTKEEIEALFVKTFKNGEYPVFVLNNTEDSSQQIKDDQSRMCIAYSKMIDNALGTDGKQFCTNAQTKNSFIPVNGAEPEQAVKMLNDRVASYKEYNHYRENCYVLDVANWDALEEKGQFKDPNIEDIYLKTRDMYAGIERSDFIKNMKSFEKCKKVLEENNTDKQVEEKNVETPKTAKEHATPQDEGTAMMQLDKMSDVVEESTVMAQQAQAEQQAKQAKLEADRRLQEQIVQEKNGNYSRSSGGNSQVQSNGVSQNANVAQQVKGADATLAQSVSLTQKQIAQLKAEQTSKDKKQQEVIAVQQMASTAPEEKGGWWSRNWKWLLGIAGAVVTAVIAFFVGKSAGENNSGSSSNSLDSTLSTASTAMNMANTVSNTVSRMKDDKEDAKDNNSLSGNATNITNAPENVKAVPDNSKTM